jgi:catechol 2,3-dioxygenase-like lactoylglutathione lyase family enzyme
MVRRRTTARKLALNHLHLHVKNVNRAQRFYESYFRFREHMRHGDILFLRNKSGFDLALVSDQKPSSFPDWFHFGFRLAGPRAVRKLQKRMSSEGVPVDELEDYGEYVSFRCTDPDGYSIEVYCS